MRRIELPSSAWEADIIAIILHPHLHRTSQKVRRIKTPTTGVEGDLCERKII